MKEKESQQNSLGGGQNEEVLPISFPRIGPISGLYSAGRLISSREPAFSQAEEAAMSDPVLIPVLKEELRLDVDGHYPQMVASGFISLSLARSVHWVARVRPAGTNTFVGGIFYKNGATGSFPYTEVKIQVVKPAIFSPPTRATLTLMGGGVTARLRTFAYVSPYFHSAEFEYDWEHSVAPITAIGTYDHPNHPASIPNERLSIETVYQRAGIRATISPNGNDLGPAPGGYWSDMEMNDAMQIYWSRFANRPQWALWVLFASLHEGTTANVPDPNLGGIMFDDIGPNERQGTSLFLKSFISQAPAGDPNPAAWVKRMAFWTATHEMGHSFNLAHSWQKALTSGGHGPWLPLANDAEARSFMNYPYRVAGGEVAFFTNFEYRFTDQELLFMRHAPERFVEMGNAEWFDNHGLRQANISPAPTFQLEVRANRPKTSYEFLEPITLELKLKNISQQPQLISTDMLSRMENLTVVSTLDGRTSRQYTPMARYCTKPDVRTLEPGEAIYDSLFISADRNGWGLADSGNYRVRAILHLEAEDIVSAPLRLRIAPPRSHEEEVIAQDYFSKEVGRVLSFDGSQAMDDANSILREVTEKLPDRRAARHAHIALGNASSRDYKMLDIKESTVGSVPVIELKVKKANVSDARKHLSKALTEQMEVSAESLGHIDYKYYVDRFTDYLKEQGDTQQAAKVQGDLHKIMAARGVIARVLDEIKSRSESYAKSKAARAGA